ncbi:ATP-dependent DNA ligase [Streptomyces syringium]|uniref:ATP-dependent DNA ligase n=1 Tax=Streptomyces syringium TaxID=76729 RepID=UPI003AAEDF12
MPEPMLAAPVEKLPIVFRDLAAEPKWDGIRAILARPDDGPVQIVSRRGTPLARAFVDIAAAAEKDLPGNTLLDGELVIWHDGRLDFDRLQQRLRSGPATIARLVATTPAHFIAFDLLHEGDTDLVPLPYRNRRAALEELFARCKLGPPWTLCPSTTQREQALQWLSGQWGAVGCEGVVLKRLSRGYLPGRRGWEKYRSRSTTEAVVGAVSPSLKRPTTVLLGRFDTEGRLRYVGRTTPLTTGQASTLADALAPAGPAHPWEGRRFTASWGSKDPLAVALVAPELVAEVSADTVVDAGGRWRHPLRWARLRVDMAPSDAPAFGQGNQPGTG